MHIIEKKIISLNKEFSENATIKSNAPSWVRDGFNEMISSGYSPTKAINHLKTSPFFKECWIQENAH